MPEKLCKHTGKQFACATCEGKKFNPDLGVRYSLHMAQGVSGPLSLWKKKDWTRMAKAYTHDDGSSVSGDQLKAEFLDHHFHGHEVFPIGQCDNFCFKYGCLGHRKESEADHA